MSLPQEYRQILDMLAEGKITTDEAQRLMEKIGAGSGSRPGAPHREGARTEAGGIGEPVPAVAGATAAVAVQASGQGSQSRSDRPYPKYLRILVSSKDGDEVNIRVPLQLVRAGLKLSTVLPTEARDRIRESGIDLSKLSELEGEDLIAALRDLSVDVDSSNGDMVRIFCE